MAVYKGKGKGKSDIVRLSTMFKTKKGGLVGSIEGKYLAKFMDEVVKPIKKGKKERITFFYRKWPGDKDPVLSAVASEKYVSKGKTNAERARDRRERSRTVARARRRY